MEKIIITEEIKRVFKCIIEYQYSNHCIFKKEIEESLFNSIKRFIDENTKLTQGKFKKDINKEVKENLKDKVNTSQEKLNEFIKPIIKELNKLSDIDLKNYINENYKLGFSIEKNDKFVKFLTKIIKDYNLTLDSKSVETEDLLFGDFKTLKRIKEENKDKTFDKKEKDLAKNIYGDLRTKWAYILVKELGISTCPYCNRNSIVNYGKDGTTVELDHYFDKGTYPYLAISLYNLVPSCHTCNHKKSGKEASGFYPYTESFNKNAKFQYNGIKSRQELKKEKRKENIDFFSPERVNFSIEPTNNDIRHKVENHKNLFNLQKLYEEHKDIIAELLQKRVIYSDAYIDSLMSQYEEKLFKNREDLLRLVTGGYISDDDINKRPLSKLIKDISEELKLI